jgi:hypothetical protein
MLQGTWQNLPAGPTPPEPKKRSRWGVVWTVVAALFVLGWISNAVDGDTATVDTPTTFTGSSSTGSSFDVTAELVVDTMPAAQVTEFCTYYAQLGDAAGYAAFANGYGTSQNPNAREVFDELVSRC